MSDIEDFTSDVLLRAKARSKYIKRTLGQEVEDTVLADPDEPETSEGTTTNSGGEGGEDTRPFTSEEVGENNNEDEGQNDSADFSSSSLTSSLSSSFSPLPLISPHRTSPRKLLPHQQLIAVAPLTPHHLTNVQVTSASPGGRVTRLKALAQTINAWDDDYSHHCPPTSRFNLSVSKSSTRKSSVAFHPYASSASSSSSSSSHSSTFTSTIVNTTTATVASDYSMDSGKSGTEKVVLDDSVLNALEAQGFVSASASPTKTKLLFDYKNPASTVVPGLKENSPRKYVLPSPQKADKSPVKRAASPVRQIPFCSKTPSPTKSPVKATVVDSVPKVVGSCIKQIAAFESSTAKEGKELPKSTAAKFEAQRGRVSVAEKAAMFESKSQIATKEIDPTELSVAERARLFEGGNSIFKKPTITSTSNNNSSINSVKGIMRSSSPTRNNNISNDNVVSAVKPFVSKMVMRPSMVPEKPLRSKLLIFEKGIREESSSEEPSTSTTTTTNTKSNIFKELHQKGVSGVPPPPPLPATSSPVVSSAPLSFRDKSGIQDDMSDVGFEESSDDNNDETLNHSTPLQRRKGSVSPTRKREVSFAIPASKSPSRTPSPTRQYANASPAKRSMPSPKSKYPGARDVKRIRVSDPKPGRIYPSLTDIETTETETDTDVDNRPVPCPPEYQDDEEQYQDEDMDSSGNSMVSGSSLGTYIERKAVENSPERNSSKQQQHHRRYRPSVVSSSAPYEEFNASLACRQVDAFIDEALEGQDISMETVIDESSPVAASSPLKNKRRSPSRSPSRAMGMNNPPLMHTVSFYRLQQSKQSTPQTTTATPKRVLEPIVDTTETSNLERTFSHEDKVNATIAKLGEEVQAQQRAIAQSSKALSLCKSTMEFSDSQENVECERILLIATQKHAALVNEIHRLKTEGILGKKDLQVLSPSKNDLGPSCQGNMKIQEVAVQLKREFVNMAMKGQKVYHFIAIAKYRHQIEASALVSMGNGITTSTFHGGVLYFPNAFTIGSLEPDFRVQVEIFMLETMREYLPHEAKYHIKKDSKGKMTPKKMKDSQSKTLFRHFQHSPAGPDVVQPCRFKPVGSLNIDISTLQRSHWTLEKVLSTSPLDGNVSIKISCSAEGGVEERGFLTMFQDVSGFGAWHRRWCKLTSSDLSFWMYPEDENNAAPLGSIPLRYCVTTRVGPVPRDVCARANTFLLVTTRSPQEGDKDSLVTSCRENYTAIRHLISADTKEERELWCRQLNRSLANLRAWDPQAHSPDDSLF